LQMQLFLELVLSKLSIANLKLKRITVCNTLAF
jgi:hypothetical protein